MTYIVAGKFKKRKLVQGKNPRVRPTKHVVREGIFSALGAMDGLHFLDLCAGVGAVGCEALSRGAERVVLVDVDTTDLTRVADLFPHEPLHIVRQSAQRYLQQSSEKFDIIYVDPPWDQPHLYAAIMTQLETHDCIQPNGRLVVEATKRFEFPVFYGQQPQRIYRYGQTVVGVYQR